MVVFTLTKYSADSRTYSFDFSSMPELIAGDTISSVASITVSPSGLTLGSNQIVGKTVQVVISGGTSGTTYTVSCLIETSSAAVLEGQGTLIVS